MPDLYARGNVFDNHVLVLNLACEPEAIAEYLSLFRALINGIGFGFLHMLWVRNPYLKKSYYRARRSGRSVRCDDDSSTITTIN